MKNAMKIAKKQPAPSALSLTFDGPVNNGPVRCIDDAHTSLLGVHVNVEAWLASCLDTYGSVPYLTYCGGSPPVWRDADDIIVLECVQG